MKNMIEAIYTIGVYGSTERSFFSALKIAQIDTFVDIRYRRGLRGSLYAYANANYLQNALQGLGVHYIHLRELAPTPDIRIVQHSADEIQGVGKREREYLSVQFADSYKEQILNQFSAEDILEKVGISARRIVLFCVEREPNACHRSFVADKLAQELNLLVQHLKA